MRDNDIERALGQLPPLPLGRAPAEPMPIASPAKRDPLGVWVAVLVILCSLVLLVGLWTVSLSLKK